MALARLANESLGTLSAREPLIKSLPEIILEFLCKTRKSNPRIVSYLRIALTKYCIKIRMISGSSI